MIAAAFAALSSHLVVAGLKWEPQIKGGLYVLIAVVVLCGSSYLLLSTNVGSRLGFQLAAAGLFGWMMIMGGVWWVYGTGPKGPAPIWKAKQTVTGSITAHGTLPALSDYPRAWKQLTLEDPEVADAQSVVDATLVPPSETGAKGRFASSSDYLPIFALEKGGETYGPLGLDFRPFNIFHKPHYMVIEVQHAIKAPTVPGQPPPKADLDPAAEPVAVVMIRDLGAIRLYPAMVSVFSGVLFWLLVVSLHLRDKEAWARREAASTA